MAVLCQEDRGVLGCKLSCGIMKKILKKHSRFFIYILECRDGTYYTGCTGSGMMILKTIQIVSGDYLKEEYNE